MKDFLLEEGLPFALVSVAVLGLTTALFGLPASAPRGSASHTPAPAAAASARRMDEALARAIAALRAARTQTDVVLPAAAKPSSAAASAAPRAGGRPAAPPVAVAPPAVAAAKATAPAAPATEAPAANTPTMSAVASLTDAVKAIRTARTEEDFVRAEQQMRTVRAQMQAACTNGASSAFCDGAREIGSLGF